MFEEMQESTPLTDHKKESKINVKKIFNFVVHYSKLIITLVLLIMTSVFLKNSLNTQNMILQNQTNLLGKQFEAYVNITSLEKNLQIINETVYHNLQNIHRIFNEYNNKFQEYINITLQNFNSFTKEYKQFNDSLNNFYKDSAALENKLNDIENYIKCSRQSSQYHKYRISLSESSKCPQTYTLKIITYENTNFNQNICETSCVPIIPYTSYTLYFCKDWTLREANCKKIPLPDYDNYIAHTNPVYTGFACDYNNLFIERIKYETNC